MRHVAAVVMGSLLLSSAAQGTDIEVGPFDQQPPITLHCHNECLVKFDLTFR